jgi:hypothetical protein
MENITQGGAIQQNEAARWAALYDHSCYYQVAMAGFEPATYGL